MVDEGQYPAKAIEHELGYAKESGNEYIAVQFEIIGGKFHGMNVSWKGFFTEKTIDRTLESLRYCGWKGDNILNLNAEGFGENLVNIVVQHNEYNGKTYANVAWVNRTGRPLVKDQLDDAQKKSFAQRIKGNVLRVDKNLAEGPPVPSSDNVQQNPPPHSDDDAPPADFDDLPF